MRDLQAIEARRAAAQRVGEPPVRDMVPAQRDFLRALGAGRRSLRFVAVAGDERDVERAVDAAVAGLAARDSELRLAAAARPPLLALDLCVAKNQVFAARIAGADAVLVPGCLPPSELAMLVSTASTTRMLPVFEVADAGELAMVLEVRPRAVLLPDAALAQGLRSGVAVLVEVSTAAGARALRGVVDAALVTRQLVLGGAFQTLVSELDR